MTYQEGKEIESLLYQIEEKIGYRDYYDEDDDEKAPESSKEDLVVLLGNIRSFFKKLIKTDSY